MPSTRTSPWSPAFRATPTRKRLGVEARMASASFSLHWPITMSSASTRRVAPTSGTAIWRCVINSALRCSAGAPDASARPRNCAARCTLSRMQVWTRLYLSSKAGRTGNEHICEALELFAAEVMPEFREKEAEREARKLAELGPAIEAAFARKRAMPYPPDAEIPTYQAYGTTIALTEADIAKLPEANRRRVLTFRRIAEIAERA